MVQFIEQTDTGYEGCFFVNLPIGLFAQKCLVKFPDSGDEPDVVTTEGEPLKCIWAMDN